MDIIVIGLLAIFLIRLFMTYLKKEYHENQSEPEEGGIDQDGDADGDGGA